MNPSEITEDKKELLDTIHNLMALVDTPLGRRQIKGDFADEARDLARKVLEKYQIHLYENH